MSVSTGKIKLTTYLFPETVASIKELFRADDCQSKSEFIEKAVNFYVGYLTADNHTSYLPNAFLSNMKAIAAESDNRQGRLLFKFSVELAMLMNIIAAYYEIDPETLDKLRGECIKEVKQLNGSFSLKDAVDWQKG